MQDVADAMQIYANAEMRDSFLESVVLQNSRHAEHVDRMALEIMSLL